MDGLLVLDKPDGLTSMAAVSRVKRALGIRKAGHTGTLDPIATGVLPICLGQATRISGELLTSEKSYRAQLMLGIATDTHDAEGQVLETTALSDDLNAAIFDSSLAEWRGEVEQIPPAFSALKVKGQRAYKLAREGKKVKLAARKVVISRLELEAWEPPYATILCDVSKGTYIRSIIRDVGTALGCGAHMTALRRLRVGSYGLEQAVPLQVLQDNPEAAHSYVIPLVDLFSSYPTIEANDHEERLFRNGAIPHSFAEHEPQKASPHRVLSAQGKILALIEHDQTEWKLIRVFPRS